MPVHGLIISPPKTPRPNTLLLPLADQELDAIRTAARERGERTDAFLRHAVGAFFTSTKRDWPHLPAGPCSRCGAETQETANVQQPRHYAFFCHDCQLEAVENA